MNADAHSAGARRGHRRLLRDLGCVEPAAPRAPARERVEHALGPELAARLLGALTPHGRCGPGRAC